MPKLQDILSIPISKTRLPSTRTTTIFIFFLLFFFFFYLLDLSSTSNTFISTLTSQLFPSFSNYSIANLSSTTKNATCDIFDGRWVYDDSYPVYAPGSCPHVENEFNCFGNGRPDLGYTKYRWQPYGCDIPRFDAKKMMEMLRGKRIVFIGDSLNRNMCESLVCSLKMFNVQRSGPQYFLRYYFKDYNCTIMFIMAPFLVQEHHLSNKRETLRLDTLEGSISKYHDADLLIFNTGHWWNHNKSKNGENFFQEGDVVHSKMDVGLAYTKALSTWANWVDKNVNKSKTQVFFSGFSNTHFRGGDWDSGGTCDNDTTPITDENMLTPYPWLMQRLETIISEMETPVMYLNITKLTDYRKDAHPSIYRRPGSKPRKGVPQDCSHWCLPGVPDSWNHLMFSSMLLSLEGSNTKGS